MASPSFDIESTADFQEFRNAIQQASKEIVNRYDLKRAKAGLELEGETLVAESTDEFSLSQAIDVLKTKAIRRGLDVKSLNLSEVETAGGSKFKQRIELQQGIPVETSKKIVASIKKQKFKVQASIQGDTVRVSGKKRDDLQKVIAHVKELDLDLPVKFTNYRG